LFLFHKLGFEALANRTWQRLSEPAESGEPEDEVVFVHAQGSEHPPVKSLTPVVKPKARPVKSTSESTPSNRKQHRDLSEVASDAPWRTKKPKRQ
jgi:hypothetical protein